MKNIYQIIPKIWKSASFASFVFQNQNLAQMLENFARTCVRVFMRLRNSHVTNAKSNCHRPSLYSPWTGFWCWTWPKPINNNSQISKNHFLEKFQTEADFFSGWLPLFSSCRDFIHHTMNIWLGFQFGRHYGINKEKKKFFFNIFGLTGPWHHMLPGTYSKNVKVHFWLIYGWKTGRFELYFRTFHENIEGVLYPY